MPQPQPRLRSDAANAPRRFVENLPSLPTTTYRTVSVDELKVFYREAGNPKAPVVLLLHGFPTSSHMYRELILALGDRYHSARESGRPQKPGGSNSIACGTDTRWPCLFPTTRSRCQLVVQSEVGESADKKARQSAGPNANRNQDYQDCVEYQSSTSFLT